MARRRPNLSPPPDDPSRAPAVVIAGDFQDGMQQLVGDVWWRWLNAHLTRAEGKNQNQRTMAAACGLDESTLGKYLNRSRRITVDAVVALQHGFSGLAQRLGLRFESVGFPDDRAVAIAGWLQAINREGVRQNVAANRRPIGVLHYYCLRVMYGNEPWYRAMAGAFESPQLADLARQIFRVASEETARVTEVLEDYRHAEQTYPLAPTFAALRALSAAWIGPWRMVYNCMGGQNP